MSPLPVRIARFPHMQDLPLPRYQTLGSAGMDLNAALSEPLVLEPGQRALIPTGVAIALNPGYEAQIRSRSGLALQKGLVVLNAPATIDSDYRGEIQVLLINHSATPLSIERGMRIAQLIVTSYRSVSWCEVDLEDLDQTCRGPQGFGSTGM